MTLHVEDRGDAAARTAYEGEHWLAWLFGAGAIAFGVLGILRAFGVYGPANTVAGQVTSVSPGGLPDTLWDGGLLLLAGLASALLALALHRNDHHRMRDLSLVPDRDEGLWNIEHGLAYLMGIATIVFTIIGLLTGFNKMGGHHWQPDGIPWLLTAIGTGLLTDMLHSVRHHQMVEEYRPMVQPAAVRQTEFVQEPTGTPVAGYRPEGPTPAGEVTPETETPRPRR